MRRIIAFIFTLSVLGAWQNKLHANEPDSAYVFLYATTKNNNHNGLHLAWSLDQKQWHAIGPEHSLVKSDYGPWGSQKKMFDPYVYYGPDGKWHAVWSLNQQDGAFAHASSTDLVYWGRQSYPLVLHDGNCLQPVIDFDAKNKVYNISWSSDKGIKQDYFVTTKDFKNFSVAKKLAFVERKKQYIQIAGQQYEGTLHKVAWSAVDHVIKSQQLAAHKHRLHSERSIDDAQRFAGLQNLKASLHIQKQNTRTISDLLMGIFFEDINYAADGGLYAELIQNRGFEYNRHVRNEWNSLTAWSAYTEQTTLTVDTVSPVHQHNKHYVKVKTGAGGGIVNEGFGGIAVRNNERYRFSIFSRTASGKAIPIVVRLLDGDGHTIGKANLKVQSKDWKNQEVEILATSTVSQAKLLIELQQQGTLDFDMVSLFPVQTFKNRKNGLRADLAQTIADMKPRFVRFPGGCVAHGNGIDNIYHWKNTIGPLEARVPQRNIWGYQQSMGLGYFEYFQFCEDLGAEPVPVLAAGVPCQNSGHNGKGIAGQQCGIPLEEMGDYIQDILDLIEYANGDVNTVWGKKRAQAGHPKPFNLKYIGIGNEDLITDVFEERFEMIFKAIKAKYPAMQVIGTAGPFYEGTDYIEGWNLASKLQIPYIDEHYYNPPGWFIHNQDFYDRYDRQKAKVYLGEYAAHIPNRSITIETALAEALHLCNVERNGDIVAMTSYAPLLAKLGNTQWNPDLIYFNNSEVKPTVGYYVQQLFGQHSGTEYIFSDVELSTNDENVRKRFAKSIVRDKKSGDIIVKLVNLLPVEIELSSDLSQWAIDPRQVSATILSGSLEDRTAQPSITTIDLHDLKLKPYSFTVLRFKEKK